MVLTSKSSEKRVPDVGEEGRTLPDSYQRNSIRPLNESAPPGTRPPTQRRPRPLCESGRERSWSNISDIFADVHMHGDNEMLGLAEPR
jgi:hypothetical protein